MFSFPSSSWPSSSQIANAFNRNHLNNAAESLWQQSSSTDYKSPQAASTQMKPHPSHLTNPFLGRSPLAPSFYLPLQSNNQSMFNPSQLSFPLFPSFPQGALVNALSNDYRRMRGGYDSAISRPIPARTTTREPGKCRGEILSVCINSLCT